MLCVRLLPVSDLLNSVMLSPICNAVYVHAALKFCYVHPNGVESHFLLQLQVCGDSEQGKEVFIEQAKGSVKV